MELLPTDAASGTTPSNITLPPQARAFGRLIDHQNIAPGDLLLTRPFGGRENDWVSRGIVKAQASAYEEQDAQWTHAAVCLGDGQNVVEANFKIPGLRRGVMIRNLQEYADGQHALKLRRPRMSDLERYRIVIGALTQGKQTYDFSYLIRLAWNAWRGRGLWDSNQRPIRISSKAVVCSTLYAQAMHYASNIELGGRARICVPALLSCSNYFTDVQLRWLALQKPTEQGQDLI
ncbi:hypothetical protein J2X57_000067 [Luteibacter sp. 1214]|uniref:hypothetical protein n=1 Tax=Luteibacter sp. 1214 TaxID=2817735 RepID=UPI002863B698|nr:hypothetical protein [Luteibacter sp. 1214]MDR6640873.1 hypothetical protein [Luteibacter sp. 1214]